MKPPTYDVNSLWHFVRCSWCWREIKNTEAIVDGENYFCNEQHRQEFNSKPVAER